MKRAVPVFGLLLFVFAGCGTSPAEPSDMRHIFRYKISLEYTSSSDPQVDVSWIGADGSLKRMEQTSLPWEQTVRVPSGTFLMLSVRRNPPFSGTITVIISQGSRALRRVTDTDPYTSATAWVKVP